MNIAEYMEEHGHEQLCVYTDVEAGLRAYDGALLVISHDRAFLEAIGVTRKIALG